MGTNMISFLELYESVDADFRYLLDERASIHEYDGRMTRKDSEFQAVKDLFTHDHPEAIEDQPDPEVIF